MRIISEQVKILLERMDLYPDEFVRPYGSRHLMAKWQEVIMDGAFNKVERFLINRKFNQLQRKATQETIMQTIMYEPTPEEGPDTYFGTTSRFEQQLKVNRALMQNTPRMRLRQK